MLVKKTKSRFSLVHLTKGLVLVFALIQFNALGQDDNNALSSGSAFPETSKFYDYLVERAWEFYPENAIFQHEIAIAQHNKALHKYSLLNNFTIQGNLNEFSISPDSSQPQSLLYPRYNISLTFTLGTFRNNKLEKKISIEELKIKEIEKSIQENELKAEVLKKYHKFKVSKEILTIQTEALEDAYSSYTIAEELFKNEKASFEEYIEAINNLNSSKIEKVRAEQEYEFAKIEIEELIGQDIEQLIKDFKN